MILKIVLIISNSLRDDSLKNNILDVNCVNLF